MAHAKSPVYSGVSVDKDMWHLLEDAVAGIHSSRRTIVRTATT